MKSQVFLVGLSVFCALGFKALAQSTEEVKISKWLKPIGLSQWRQYEYGAYNTYREYLLGDDDGYVKYEWVSLNLTVPRKFPKKKEIPYVQLVESGVQSLLLEYKNYRGKVTSAWYWLLAMGNYCKMTPQLLKWANDKLFPDQDLLKAIYQWVLPTYRCVFEDLTYEEQVLITGKLEAARQYVLIACQEKSLKRYKLWLKEHQMEFDEKWCGFFNRRLQKKQWTIEDCLFWIQQVERDLPAIKSKDQASAHYQIIQKINAHYMIGCDAKGNYYLLDGGYKVISNAYAFIKVLDNDDIAMYESIEDLVPYHYYFEESDGSLIKPYLSSWKRWRWASDSSLTYLDQVGMGIYFIHSGRTICTGSKIIVPYEHFGIFGVMKEQDGQRSVHFYNNDGVELFSDQEFGWYDFRELYGDNPSGWEEWDYLSPPASFSSLNDFNYLQITNSERHEALIGYRGRVLLPFEYDSIRTTTDPNVFYAYHYQKGREVYYIASDEEICSVVDLSLQKGNCAFLKYPLNVVAYRNGDTLFHARTHEEWTLAATHHIPAWCYLLQPNGERAPGSYRLYNGYALTDGRDLAPPSWRLAGMDDFECWSKDVAHSFTMGNALYPKWSCGHGYRQADGGYIHDDPNFNYWVKEGWGMSIEALSPHKGRQPIHPLNLADTSLGKGYWVRCVKEDAR